ncbi:hypothetical protein H0A36_15090 [Endozoicomonas sp. SM1973]|uniref:Uncharacterized protein n=1 Tax=Spartinivicinus marinus TaxID=2994442 RepID=A0A853IBT6_9GAMM|nr:hypothetical protein [Spartinivicinus marinus]MCX4026244.1 hypothetical protein [Spartinivicinus marinus]NYZ67341.1 hypothetical protein [Spartinivicinus marinus]
MQQIVEQKKLTRLTTIMIIVTVIILLLFIQKISNQNSTGVEQNSNENDFYPINLLQELKNQVNLIDIDIDLIQQTKNNLKFKIKYKKPGLLADSVVLSHIKAITNTAISILLENKINPYSHKITIDVTAESPASATQQDITPFRYNFIRYGYSPRFPTDLFTTIQSQISRLTGELNIIEMAKDRLSFQLLLNNSKELTPYKIKKETKRILNIVLQTLSIYNINYKGDTNGIGGIHIKVKSFVPQQHDNNTETTMAYGIAYYNPSKKRILWTDSYHLSYTLRE